MRGDHRQRRLTGALPDQVVAAFGVDFRVVMEAAQAVALAQVERLAVERDRLVQRLTVADHHAIERGERERSRCAVVIADVDARPVARRPAPAMAPIGENAFVEQQAVHALAR